MKRNLFLFVLLTGIALQGNVAAMRKKPSLGSYVISAFVLAIPLVAASRNAIRPGSNQDILPSISQAEMDYVCDFDTLEYQIRKSCYLPPERIQGYCEREYQELDVCVDGCVDTLSEAIGENSVSAHRSWLPMHKCLDMPSETFRMDDIELQNFRTMSHQERAAVVRITKEIVKEQLREELEAIAEENRNELELTREEDLSILAGDEELEAHGYEPDDL